MNNKVSSCERVKNNRLVPYGILSNVPSRKANELKVIEEFKSMLKTGFFGKI